MWPPVFEQVEARILVEVELLEHGFHNEGRNL